MTWNLTRMATRCKRKLRTNYSRGAILEDLEDDRGMPDGDGVTLDAKTVPAR